jgi:dipeptidyl aminopeptidase/acylaminoacyl peptidase
MIILSLNLVLISSFVFATNKLNPEMVMNIKSISNPVISPDGNYVAYLKLIPPKENEGKKYRYSDLNIMDLKTRTTNKIKSIYSTSSSPASRYQWSEDSQYLYYTAKYKEIHEKKQVYKISVINQNPELITHHETDISKFTISKDEKNIVYLAKKKKSQEKEKLKNNGFDWIINEQKCDFDYLFFEEIEKKEIVKITPDSLHVFNFALEPNTKNVIYQTALKCNKDYSYMFRDVFRISIEYMNNEKLFDHDGKLGKMKISPDGNFLAFLGGIDISDPSDGSLLVSEIGSGKWENFTEDFQGSVIDFKWLDSKTIIFNAETFNHTTVYKMNLNDREYEKLFGKGVIVKSLDLAKENQKFICTASNYNHLNELFLSDINGKKLERITHSNPELENVEFIPYEDFFWEARDGIKVSGLLLKPANFKPDASSPLYIYVHGGPEGVVLSGWNNSYNKWPQIMADKGCVVLMPNYRGSTGRGVEWSKGDHGDMMGVDFNDVLDGIDALIEKKWIDPNKVGISGGSYGGYMTAWASTKYSDRFAVGVMSAGISNQISKIGMTDTPHENSLVHWNSYSWDTDFNLAWERSPLKYFKNHKTPLLIAHGDKDERVPPGQSYELYRALHHINQAPVELIIYPGEKHGLKMRAHRYHFMINALNWLEKYLLSDN